MSGEHRALPVVVVDDHHHCLRDIHLAIRQRRLPFSDIHIVHVDAHPDLSFPASINTNDIFEPKTLYDLLDDSIAGIAEFQLPLVFAGHVNQITWIKPSWATQMPTGAFKQLAIGKRRSNGSLGVTSELPHFVEDDLFCPEKDMEVSSIRHWDLIAAEVGELSSVDASVTTEAIENARNNSKGYVLDVDLDYFSTWNPFRRDLEARIGVSAVATVTRVFSSVRYKQCALGAVSAEQRCSDKTQFCELIKLLQNADALEDTSERKAGWKQLVQKLTALYAEDANAEQIFLEFELVLDQLRDNKIARDEIWTAGSFLDLPHHESSQKEIEHMINDLEHFLRASHLDASNLPAIVTIAKSTGDEYLPPHQVDAVLSNMLQMLERVYGELSTQVVEYESA